MSGHVVKMEIQEMAACIQTIRKELDLIEFIVQQSLISEKENGNGESNRAGQEG